jgi:hypothetical protein
MGPTKPGIATKLIARMSSDFAKVRNQGEPSDGHHHGAAAALQHTAGDQDMNPAGHTAEPGAKREKGNGGSEHAASSEVVRHPAASGNENRQAERVAGQHRLHAEWRNSQRGGDRRHRRVQNGGVQRLHEEGDCDQPWQQSFAGTLYGFSQRARHRANWLERKGCAPVGGERNFAERLARARGEFLVLHSFGQLIG